ncbi:hypothetical protein ADUPG1_009127 [Aduncisulcus paluster]|uniref:RNI-like protein n=1 Tax=Aduncisulcus paluster TaxID=2918883 RepID=A0ABQ5KXD1_9EUKA|nr:hypothetical protein ADUPG1_009127 [Aduncisulcus paluster]
MGSSCSKVDKNTDNAASSPSIPKNIDNIEDIKVEQKDATSPTISNPKKSEHNEYDVEEEEEEEEEESETTSSSSSISNKRSSKPVEVESKKVFKEQTKASVTITKSITSISSTTSSDKPTISPPKPKPVSVPLSLIETLRQQSEGSIPLKKESFLGPSEEDIRKMEKESKKILNALSKPLSHEIAFQEVVRRVGGELKILDDLVAEMGIEGVTEIDFLADFGDLSTVEARSVRQQVERMKRLERFIASPILNEITSVEARCEIIASLPSLQCLEELFVSVGSAAEADYLSTVFSHLPSLSILRIDFRGCTPDICARRLISSLSHLEELTSLSIGSLVDGDLSLKALGSIIASLPCLRELNLFSLNNVNYDGMQSVCECIGDELEELRSFSCDMVTLDDDMCRCIGDMLKERRKTLRRLTLSACSMTSEGVKIIASRGLKHLRYLTDLDLAYSGVDCDCIKNLMEAIASCSELEVLALQGNKIDDMGALVISKVVSDQLLKLDELNLYSNSIGKSGMRELTRVLSEHPTISRVYLGDNSKAEDDSEIKSLMENVEDVCRRRAHKMLGG